MYVITGANGRLGRLVVAQMLRSVPASSIVAVARSAAPDLAEQGVAVRTADYDDPAGLPAALEGATRLLLISSNANGRRVPQHRAVIDAAARAGVSLLAYTSVLHADTSPLGVAPEHLATERYIRALGLPYAFLRNGWYSENYLPAVEASLDTGVIHGAARDGSIASASRLDYAAAAAAVLLGDQPAGEGIVHELSGDTAWTMRTLAALVTELSGRPVRYRDLPVESFAEVLRATGRPGPAADMFARIDAHIADGWLASTPGELRRLIGRPTTPLRDTLAEALSAGPDRS
jgi:NAD(P)H dehydrogenase (quinone)